MRIRRHPEHVTETPAPKPSRKLFRKTLKVVGLFAAGAVGATALGHRFGSSNAVTD